MSGGNGSLILLFITYVFLFILQNRDLFDLHQSVSLTPTLTLTLNLPLPRRLYFSPMRVFLYYVIYVCQQEYTETTDRISTKLGWRMKSPMQSPTLIAQLLKKLR